MSHNIKSINEFNKEFIYKIKRLRLSERDNINIQQSMLYITKDNFMSSEIFTDLELYYLYQLLKQYFHITEPENKSTQTN